MVLLDETRLNETAALGGNFMSLTGTAARSLATPSMVTLVPYSVNLFMDFNLINAGMPSTCCHASAGNRNWSRRNLSYLMVPEG